MSSITRTIAAPRGTRIARTDSKEELRNNYVPRKVATCPSIWDAAEGRRHGRPCTPVVKPG